MPKPTDQELAKFFTEEWKDVMHIEVHRTVDKYTLSFAKQIVGLSPGGKAQDEALGHLVEMRAIVHEAIGRIPFEGA